jgi:SPP1 family predicted phage head-tail adaptor
MALMAGKLDHRLTLVHDSAVSYDSRGQSEQIREEVATVWGSIEPFNGAEGELANQKSPTGTVQVTIRYSTDVNPIAPSWWFETSDRLGNTRKLQIQQIVEKDERSEVFTCLCGETILEKDQASS